MRGAVCPIGVLISGTLVLLLSAHASAGSPREHDGFFLRLSAGAGAAQTELEEFSSKLKLSGASGDVNIAIGGMLARNLALHGTLFGWLLSEPDVEVDGSELGSAENVDVDLSALGAGLTYYFMPANVYLSGSAGAATLSLDAPNVEGETDTGFFGEVTVGKEWWVSDGWGLGVAGAAGFHSIPDGDVGESWSGPSFALRFTATLN